MSIENLPRTIEWIGGINGFVRMIDQTKLPTELVMLQVNDTSSMWHAIKRLSVRGAPAIGIAAAMGAVLGVRGYPARNLEDFCKRLDESCTYLASSRPTAVNLTWALQRLQTIARNFSPFDLGGLKARLLEEAKRIRDEDEEMCRAIGRHGAELIEEQSRVLTHCNAGSLATAYFGTALAPIYAAHAAGRTVRVYADETRPLLQGARLTAWELERAGINVTVLCDNAAATLLRDGEVDLVITGADRIAANGDAANKIGTYGLAVLARVHSVPFYVAAPSSTFDLTLPDGSAIPIELRDAQEVREGFGPPTAPPKVPCLNPAFDVTPAELITGLITEHGIIRPVSNMSIESTISRAR